MKEACKGQIIKLDGNRAEGVILEEIVRILKLTRSKGPRRPPRILLMGPPGCSKTEHAQHLSYKYKVQYVKVSHLIKDFIRNDKNKERAVEMRSLLESCKPFPNKFIIDLVKTRLEKPDCRTNGWILDGCPTTTE